MINFVIYKLYYIKINNLLETIKSSEIIYHIFNYNNLFPFYWTMLLKFLRSKLGFNDENAFLDWVLAKY